MRCPSVRSGTASQTQLATQSFTAVHVDAVIRVYDSGVPNPRPARAMQDGVLQLRLANRAEFIYDGAFDAERTFHRVALRLCHCGTNARAGSGRHS